METAVALTPDQTSKPDTNWNQLLAGLGEHRDKAVYIRLYRHFAPRIKSYIMRLGLLESTAEELMQETMLSVWRKAHMYNPQKAAASTWIFVMARNQSIDWMRKQKYPTCPLEEWSDDATVECNGEQEVVSDRVQDAIRQLPAAQQQVVKMSFLEGRTHSEIADRLGIPLGSVKSRIRLASEKLRNAWEGEI